MTTSKRQKTVKTRRLSPWRVVFAIALVTLSIGTAAFGWREWRVDPTVKSNQPWFAPYVDVTASPQFGFEQLGANSQKDAVLSFVVADQKDNCSPSWGGAYSLSQASDDLDLDRRIARLQQQGGSIAVSFGGLKNNELATVCSDESKLVDAYRKVVERYDVSTVDLDLENDNLKDLVVNARRAKAIAQLQEERRAINKPFAVWVTLPVTAVGLNQHGTDAVSELLKADVDVAGVNIMAMNYSANEVGDKSLSEVSINALKNTKRQLSVLYNQNGTYLNDVSVWRKIGITPMIGQTNHKGQVFTLNDAKRVNKFAHENGVGRVSMWSANRDVQCGANYIDTAVVSDSCSGVKQDKFAFTLALGSGFSGNIVGTAENVTKSQAKPSEKDLADDPATSPYQVWTESGTYLEGTKVVWHHNVYQAKWWTKGNIPDNPVLQSFQTPWDLIGPVLAGEKPIQQATLPEGTYEQWNGDAAYETDTRVLFNGVPYQAKWWNRGDSPAAASSSADASPWTPLTQAQIEKIVAELNG